MGNGTSTYNPATTYATSSTKRALPDELLLAVRTADYASLERHLRTLLRAREPAAGDSPRSRLRTPPATASDAKLEVLLVEAAKLGRLACIELLMTSGDRTTAWSTDAAVGASVAAAAGAGQLEALELVVAVRSASSGRSAKRVVASATDERKRSALHMAARGGAADCVEYLSALVPEQLHATDARGRTPLHSAALRGRTAACRALIEAGAAHAAADASGDTPRVLAERASHAATAAVLRGAGQAAARSPARGGRRRAQEAAEVDPARLMAVWEQFFVNLSRRAASQPLGGGSGGYGAARASDAEATAQPLSKKSSARALKAAAAARTASVDDFGLGLGSPGSSFSSDQFRLSPASTRPATSSVGRRSRRHSAQQAAGEPSGFGRQAAAAATHHGYGSEPERLPGSYDGGGGFGAQIADRSTGTAWTRHFDDDANQWYWFNADKGTASWEVPARRPSPSPSKHRRSGSRGRGYSGGGSDDDDACSISSFVSLPARGSRQRTTPRSRHPLHLGGVSGSPPRGGGGSELDQWRSHWSSEHQRTYYTHETTGESRWDRPRASAASSSSSSRHSSAAHAVGDAAVGVTVDGYTACWDEDHECRWYHCVATGESSWEPPPPPALAYANNTGRRGAPDSARSQYGGGAYGRGGLDSARSHYGGGGAYGRGGLDSARSQYGAAPDSARSNFSNFTSVSRRGGGHEDEQPHMWMEAWSAADDASYYVHRETGETSWAEPRGWWRIAQAGGAWREIYSEEHGCPYWLKQDGSGETRWEAPGAARAAPPPATTPPASARRPMTGAQSARRESDDWDAALFTTAPAAAPHSDGWAGAAQRGGGDGWNASSGLSLNLGRRGAPARGASAGGATVERPREGGQQEAPASWQEAAAGKSPNRSVARALADVFRDDDSIDGVLSPARAPRPFAAAESEAEGGDLEPLTLPLVRTPRPYGTSDVPNARYSAASG